MAHKFAGVLCTALLFSVAIHAQETEYDLSVRILKRDGTPAAGLHVKVVRVLVSSKLVPLVEDDLPADGTIRLEGLLGGPDRPVHRIYAGPDDEQIDTFRYTGPEEPPVHELKLPLMAGDLAPEVSFVNVLTGARSKLSDYRGQVVYLDFWGTWCVPCRRPMIHSEDVMKRRAKEWEGKAAIIALSVDDEIEVARKYINERGWTSIIHVSNADSPTVGWECRAVQDFGLDDIPRAVLIGKDGTILWRGDPNKVDPEQMIDERLR